MRVTHGYGRFVPALLAALAAGCATVGEPLETPRLSLIHLRLLEAGVLEQRYELTFRVQNPNGVSLPVKGISYEVSLAGSPFATGVTPERFSVPAYGEAEFAMQVSTNLLSTVRHLSQWLESSPEALDYTLSGKLQIDLPFVGAMPFSSSGAVPLKPADRSSL